MPLESIQTDFSNKTYAIRKKIHRFFLLLRSSILKLNYLCDLRSLISKIRPCSSPLNLLSNATGFTSFGFLKTKLCTISYDDLIMDWFSRANLYNLPHVIVSSFGSKFDKNETIVCVLATNFTSQNNANQYLKFFHYVPWDFRFALWKFQLLKPRRKIFIAKIPWWPI